MRVLITGFSGFVGSHLSGMLIERGHEVYGLAKHETDKSAIPHERRYYLDLLNFALVQEIVDKISPEAIIHLAAQASVAESWRMPEHTFRINVEGTISLLKACLKSKHLIRWINAGSAEEYLIPSEHIPISEDNPLVPSNPYGVSKLAQEYLIQQLLSNEQIALVQFRMFNLIGPGQSEKFVLGSFARQLGSIKKGLETPVLRTGDLKKERDFLDVRDACRVYCEALEEYFVPGIYNLASGEGRSLLEVVKEMIKISGLSVEISPDPIRFRKIDPEWIVGSVKRLRSVVPNFKRVHLTQSVKDLLSEF